MRFRKKEVKYKFFCNHPIIGINNFNMENSKIVTAICKDPTTKTEKNFLHCFVSTMGKDGVEYILDGTLNVVIDKETYLNLFNAKIISEIEREKMIEDVEFFKSNYLSEFISFVEYLCFKDEVMEGLKSILKLDNILFFLISITN